MTIYGLSMMRGRKPKIPLFVGRLIEICRVLRNHTLVVWYTCQAIVSLFQSPRYLGRLQRKLGWGWRGKLVLTRPQYRWEHRTSYIILGRTEPQGRALAFCPWPLCRIRHFTQLNWGRLEPTSFPGSRFFPYPSLSFASGDGKKRDPGNEVGLQTATRNAILLCSITKAGLWPLS